MKSLSKNSIFYIIYTSLNVLFPFITGVYVAHVLFENTIGEVEAARNFVQYFVMLAYLGIPTYGLRQISRARDNREELSKVFSELVIINFVSTVFFSIVYVVMVFSIPTYSSDVPLYLIMGGLIALNALNITWLYEGLEEFSFICVRNLIFKILCFVLLVIFVRKNSDYLMYAVITTIGVAGNYIFNVLHAKRFVFFKFKGLKLMQHLKPILFLTAVNLAIEIYTMVDITMLKLLTDNESVAFYSYGSKIYKIIINIINVFTIVVVPRLAYYYKQKQVNKFNELLTKTLNVILLISIPAIIGVFFTSDYLITAIYGANYIRSSQVLKILSIIFVVSPIGYLLGSRVLLTTGREKLMVIPVAIGAITNVICNYFLITSFKEVGASIASVIGEIVVAVVYISISRKAFKIDRCFKNILKVLIASLVVVVALIAISFSNEPSLLTTLKQIVVSICLYFAILFVLKEETVFRHTHKLLNVFF